MAKKNNTGGNNSNNSNKGNNPNSGTKNIGLGYSSDAGKSRGSGSGNRPSKPKKD